MSYYKEGGSAQGQDGHSLSPTPLHNFNRHLSHGSTIVVDHANGSMEEIDAISQSSLSLSTSTRHRRTRSDVSALSVMSYTGSEVLAAEELSQDPVLFAEDPPKNLHCMVCQKIFNDPVIARCGHTFCRVCILNSPPNTNCPVHMMPLSRHNLISNLAVSEQINELNIHCKYGVKPVEGEIGVYEVDDNGCKHIIKLGNRNDHESQCSFMPARCPNSPSCGEFNKVSLSEHLQVCVKHSCPHKLRGCNFTGTKDDLESHLRVCKFESVRDILEKNDDRIDSLKTMIEERDSEIELLRGMLVQLTQRFERLEANLDSALVNTDEHLNRVWVELQDTKRVVTDNSRDISAVQARLGLVSGIGLMGQPHKIKCQGTFVGHQGPVWALASTGNQLFSASSDETIKVWDTSKNFACKRTLHAHRGIIHTLIVHGHKLFSGSSDGLIKAWHVDTLELLHTMEGHSNPVCTLACANGLLFSGSHKTIKMWDVHTHQYLGELTGLNHWVRALVATEEYLIAGSYQTISIWSSRPEDLLQQHQGQPTQPQKLHVLQTSGGSVYSLCVSSRFIICGTFEKLIHVWDLKTKTLESTLSGHTGQVYALAVVDDGQGQERLFSASYDKTIRVWNLDKMTCAQTLIRHQNSVDCLCVQKGRIFSGAADCTVKVWQ